MAKKKKNEFQVRISNCGKNYVNFSHDKISGKYALDVCNIALIIMLREMVGVKNINKSLYLMSLYHLKELHDEFNEKFPELKNEKVEDFLKNFEIKDD